MLSADLVLVVVFVLVIVAVIALAVRFVRGAADEDRVTFIRCARCRQYVVPSELVWTDDRGYVCSGGRCGTVAA